jgi:hypothetical protein
MSLQVGLNNNFIPQNSGYASGAAGQAAMPPAGKNSAGQGQTIDSIRNDKLMKKIGAVECQTCRNRKYVDGSDDAGVSFKAPAHVSPESSMAAVASHEQEHVSREGAKAQADGREIVSQSVRIYTDVCPECGRVYASGGKTTTTTRADKKNTDYFMENMRKSMGMHFGKYIDKRL